MLTLEDTALIHLPNYIIHHTYYMLPLLAGLVYLLPSEDRPCYTHSYTCGRYVRRYIVYRGISLSLIMLPLEATVTLVLRNDAA